MKKVTISSTVLAASLCFGTQSAMAAGSLDDKDMLFAFGAESSVNTMMLSEREMLETEGELFLGGALAGGGTYLASTGYRSWDSSSNYGFNENTWNNFTYNFSTTDLLWATGAGAVGGAYAQSLFRGVGYTGMANQIAAPLVVQTPIRAGGAGVGFSTFGVHGYPSTRFETNVGNRNDFSQLNSYLNNNNSCRSCYRSNW